jgi:hypothetical protein
MGRCDLIGSYDIIVVSQAVSIQVAVLMAVFALSSCACTNTIYCLLTKHARYYRKACITANGCSNADAQRHSVYAR